MLNKKNMWTIVFVVINLVFLGLTNIYFQTNQPKILRFMQNYFQSSLQYNIFLLTFWIFCIQAIFYFLPICGFPILTIVLVYYLEGFLLKFIYLLTNLFLLYLLYNFVQQFQKYTSILKDQEFIQQISSKISKRKWIFGLALHFIQLPMIYSAIFINSIGLDSTLYVTTGFIYKIVFLVFIHQICQNINSIEDFLEGNVRSDLNSLIYSMMIMGIFVFCSLMYVLYFCFDLYKEYSIFSKRQVKAKEPVISAQSVSEKPEVKSVNSKTFLKENTKSKTKKNKASLKSMKINQYFNYLNFLEE